jgi:hypothetical protein
MLNLFAELNLGDKNMVKIESRRGKRHKIMELWIICMYGYTDILNPSRWYQ